MSTNPTFVLRESIVESVEDNYRGLRIKARLIPEDNGKDIKDVPYAFPLIPKHFAVNPKKDEMVLIITNDINSPNKRRWFIGPIISQDYYLNKCEALTKAKTLLDDGNGDLMTCNPEPNPVTNPENDGTLPDRDDIAIRGRNNADLIFKDNELRLRCGFKLYPHSPDDLTFNTHDLAYIKMKYQREYENGESGTTYASSINLVADKINLLTHHSIDNFTLTNSEELITDNEMKTILQKAHSLPYGDKLIEFLKQFITVFANHTHPYPMMKPNEETDMLALENFNLDSLLSKNIKIS